MEETRYENNRLRSRTVVINDNESIYENYYDNEINSLEIQKFFNNGIVMAKEYYESGNLKLQTLYEDGEAYKEISYYDNNKIKSEVYYKNWKKHNTDSPAVIYYKDDESQMIVYKAYYSFGNLHNHYHYAEWKFDKYEEYDENYNGTIYSKSIEMEFNWYKNGIKYKSEIRNDLHKINEKNIYEDHNDEIEYEDGKILSIKRTYNNSRHFEMYEDGKIYRKYVTSDSCSYTEYYDNGYIEKRIWRRGGNLYRENDLPSVEYYKDEKIVEKRWYKYGIKHRDNGFAIEYYKDNVLISGEIWKNGKRIINFEKYHGIEICSICYELKDNMILTRCRHIFCKDCIHKWVDSDNDRCPYCRQKI